MSEQARQLVPAAAVETTATTARLAAVAKFRELATRIESGELHGARVEWRHGLDVIKTVEVDRTQVRFNTLQAVPEVRTSLDAREVPFRLSKPGLLAYIDDLVVEIERLKLKCGE